jgi:hypothetical protein
MGEFLKMKKRFGLNQLHLTEYTRTTNVIVLHFLYGMNAGTYQRGES